MKRIETFPAKIHHQKTDGKFSQLKTHCGQKKNLFSVQAPNLIFFTHTKDVFIKKQV
jgi:hypothetical protein